jgi:putative ABC transport system permease protein
MFLDSLRESLRNLIRRPLQSTLAILGIFVGVAGSLVLSSVGQGVTVSVNQQITAIGPGLMTIVPTPSSNGQPTVQLSLNDANSISSAEIDDGVLSPLAQSIESVVHGSQVATAPIEGVDANFTEITPITLNSGRFFNALEQAHHSQVAILSKSLAGFLFPHGSAIGQTVMISGDLYTIIGVGQLDSGGQTGGSSNLIFMPVGTVLDNMRGTNIIDALLIKVDNPALVNNVSNQVLTTLLQDHHWSIKPSQLTVYKQNSILTSANNLTGLIRLFVRGAMLIALVLGGLGITNVMLMAAMERRHEVGVYFAFGARRGFVQLQFLLEAVWISLFGVVGGLIGGTLAGLVIAPVAKLPWAFSVTPYLESVIGGLFLGILFGVYPSFRASRIHPAEAIRTGV